MSGSRKVAGPPASAKDLNELLHAHQVELMKASSSDAGATRANHFDQVAQFANDIRNLRKISPEALPARGNTEPHTIIYGSYAGASAHQAPTSRSSGGETRAGSENPDRGRADD